MAFVKLDTKILNSTTWLDADACKVFITALLMAEPYEVREPIRSIQVRSTDEAEFVVPVGWYGFVPAAGPGIAYRAIVEQDRALDALERLASPDPGSRTPDHDGRRMVRVSGGYLILNYIAHRDRDHGAAERQARFRTRQKMKESNARTVTPVTHADADADAEADTSRAKSKATVRATPAPVPAGDAAAVVEAYHRILPKCQRISVLNPKRKKRIAAASKLARQVSAEQGWDWKAGQFWDSYFGECAADPWMRGEVANPKNPAWVQSLDVLLAEDRFAGVMDRAIASMGQGT